MEEATNTTKKPPHYTYHPHPWYGPCDGIADGYCTECNRIILLLRAMIKDDRGITDENMDKFFEDTQLC